MHNASFNLLDCCPSLTPDFFRPELACSVEDTGQVFGFIINHREQFMHSVKTSNISVILILGYAY